MPWITAGATVAGGLLGSKGSKGQQQTIQAPQANTSFSQLTPNAAAMPLYGFLGGNAQQLMQTPIPYFPGQTYISPSQLTQQGLQQQKNMLGMAGQNYDFLSQSADVANNPYVQAMMKQNAQASSDWLNNQALPSLQSGSIGVNALGSDRLGLAQGKAAADAQKNLLAQNAQTQMGAYTAGLGAQQNALGSTGAMMGNMMRPGQTVEGYQQAALQDQMNRFNYMYQEPYQRMNAVAGWAQALAPVGIQQGSSMGVSSQQNPNYQSPMQGMLGGASLGGRFGQALAPMIMGTPYGNGGRSAGLFTGEVMPAGVMGPPAPAWL